MKLQLALCFTYTGYFPNFTTTSFHVCRTLLCHKQPNPAEDTKSLQFYKCVLESSLFLLISGVLWHLHTLRHTLFVVNPQAYLGSPSPRNLQGEKLSCVE